MSKQIRKAAPTDRPRVAEIAKRLKKAVKQAGGNKRVSEASGVSESTLNTYLAGLYDPKVTTLERIAKACGLAVGDLLGEGRTDSSTENCTSIPGLAEEAQPYESAPGFVFVPRLQVEAAAGGGRLARMEGIESGDVIAFREDWMRRIGVSPLHAQALLAIGDSMEPTIRDGDLLLIDRSVTRIVGNDIYVVVYAGLVIVKRVLVRRDGSVVLRSDNDALHDEEVVPAHDLGSLIIEGRVRWIGRSI